MKSVLKFNTLSRGIKGYRGLSGNDCKDFIVLGVETSCDDTGVGVVTSSGAILADSRHSQLAWHQKTGGVNPKVAGKLHREYLGSVMETALRDAGIKMKDVYAVAATVGPGLALSLEAGMDFTKKLVAKENKPFIPVHHMEAHALTACITHPVSFPFLVLLASGGHCILTVCEGPGKFLRLGECRDDAPGEAFDKIARALRLHTHPLVSDLSGGRAIEVLAKFGNPEKFPFPRAMSQRLDCMFSFSGIKTHTMRVITSQEANDPTGPHSPVLQCEDISAASLAAISRHLVTRTQRAILYCIEKWPTLNHLVVSGGVASNLYLRKKLEELASYYGYHFSCPEPSLCTDNGVMIAWAGIEHIKAGLPLMKDLSTLKFIPKWRLGKDISNVVADERIKVKVKMKY
uniref:N(6)-L-threonylcarbamoyladenine synthase n=2 Tax=Amphimedon queenslandica TaxID=400682 RepID=A0A1X7V0T3_AMPQE